MSKKSIIEREKKRQKLFKKYYKKKKELKNIIKSKNKYKTKRKAYFLLQSIPKNANKIRIRKRCLITGRPRGFINLFGISRIEIRRKIMNCEIPGTTKSSW
ncbi:MAG: 30S ribosomal protein S14 [Candidatus Vidania fulgoroideorum]